VIICFPGLLPTQYCVGPQKKYQSGCIRGVHHCVEWHCDFRVWKQCRKYVELILSDGGKLSNSYLVFLEYTCGGDLIMECFTIGLWGHGRTAGRTFVFETIAGTSPGFPLSIEIWEVLWLLGKALKWDSNVWVFVEDMVMKFENTEDVDLFFTIRKGSHYLNGITFHYTVI